MKRKAYSYIRMSSDIQLKGDSLRRQLEASEKYARDHDLLLVDAIDGTPLKDIGVSGFRGANSKDGVLAKFLEHLEKGKIEGRSVLLIESLDRLSRAVILDALQQFISIVSYDIEIVTLSDGQRYTKESLNQNPSQLFVSLGIMMRANEESEIKSLRMKAAWTNKRHIAAKTPMTKAVPAWLRISDSTGQFEVISERAKIVSTIFEMCANVCGQGSIAQRLNQAKVPVFGRSNYWHLSYIKKIIHNRAVLGEFQPHTKVEGKRLPQGDAIPNYYPRIIDDELFQLANAAVKRRQNSSSGRKGKSFSNLFSRLIFCGSCGSTVRLRNRGNTYSGGKYFICSNAYAKAGCTSPEWRYDTIESRLIAHLREINFSELLGNINVGAEIENQLLALRNKRDELQNSVNKFLDLVQSEQLSDPIKPTILERLNTLARELEDIERELLTKQNELEEYYSQIRIFREDEIKLALKELEDKKDDYYFRSSINQLLGKSILGIDLIVDDRNYLPLEVDPEDSIVTNYRTLHPELNIINHDNLVERKDFKEYWSGYQKRIRIRYKTGAVRQLLVGYDVSFSNESSRKQYKDQFGHFITKEEAESREPGTYTKVLVKQSIAGKTIR